MKQLGTSQIDNRNRIYIPQEVLDILPHGDRLSWELDDNGCVCIFMGHERFIRKNNNRCPRKRVGGEERDGKSEGVR